MQSNKTSFKARLLKGLAFFCLKFLKFVPIKDLSPVTGWLSTLFLSLCGLPEAVHSILEGHSGAPWSLLILWGLGEVFAVVYVWPRRDWPLLLNYGLNILTILTIILAGKL